MDSDKELQEEVLEELRWEPGVKATNIRATVKDGVVTLEGTVDSIAEKSTAERAVKRLPGVRALAIELEVKLPASSERTDVEIARAAEHAFKWNDSVPADSFRVIVENGRVTLEGEVDWQFQRANAEQAVLYLTGVKEVTNLITLKPKGTPTDVKAKIEAAFKRNAILDAQRIKVQADEGKVTLSGNVRSWAERDEAERAAWAAPGVSDVKNLIAVSP